MFDITTVLTWLRKNITMRDVLIISGIIALYCFTRLVNLTRFPIFTDEGIYIHWSYVAWKDAAWRFISLTDGRQPLQTWATIPFLKLFPDDKLLAGRLFSVTFGFLGLAGLLSFMWYEFGKRAAHITALLYVVTPYFLFHDRMALVDSAITAFVIWMFFLAIVLARTLRLDVALILGMLTGLALLGKSSVRLYAGLMLFSFLFIVYTRGMRIRGFVAKLFGKNHARKELLNFLILYGVVIALAIAIYNVQRLSPYMHFIEQKNTTFVLTLSELLKDPFAYFTFNIWNIPYYILSEMGYIVGLLGLAGLYVMYRKHTAMALYMCTWLALGVVMLSFVGKVVYPRYVMPFGGLLLIPAGFLLAEVQNKKIIIGIVAAIAVSVLYYNYTILYQPANIPFPSIDRGQYIEGWPAGLGIREISDYAKSRATDRPVYIVADGDFGMSGDVLRVHVNDGDNVHIKAYWPLDDADLRENQVLLANSHVLVVYPHCKEANYIGSISEEMRCAQFERTKPLKLIRAFKKPGNSAAVYLFELLPGDIQ